MRKAFPMTEPTKAELAYALRRMGMGRNIDPFEAGDPDDTYYGDEDAEIQATPELQESRFYCKHGNYIGTPGGADYMCGLCESE